MDYELDEDNPGWVKGWAVLRNDPWDLAGFFPTLEQASAYLKEKGPGYAVRLGSKRLATDDFVGE
ncbi:hypothetical protein LMG3410_02075 [Achromobacter aegrifaciens]|uniref:DUF1330 domain-containing protein n=1 Tax=Achromobacter aegrifaciens TaxID=1287736 RepID=A0ABU2D8W2_ACHAE|nr:hypothetical protein [Achromobacter aegrifaciens]MDR7944546.1 hypothetical protein [Achromobacter aegrifaciens]CAB3856921.1 hypothetical protein LMG3410_02075 [Achromobacter aegrifaciens]